MSWRDDYFDSFFEEMSREFREMKRMMDSMFRAVRSWQPGTNIEGPYYYGFSVTIGPDGKPMIREFGNVRPNALGNLAVGTREPLIETVVDDMEDRVIISAERGNKKYYTEIPLPAQVDPASSEATYNNGILEVKLKLKQQVRQKGTSIKVK